MRSNTLKFLLGFLIIFILLSGAFSGGFLVGHSTSLLNSKSESTTDSTQSVSKSEELDKLFQPFWEAWNYVEENYVDQPVDQTKMMQGAIDGMLNSLDDPHTSYMNPDMYRQQSTPLQGEYDGIGAWVDLTGEF